MKKPLNIALGVLLLLSFAKAYAVPSFARQTGLSCNVCHRNAPELTSFGRNFKLRGYVLNDLTPSDEVGVIPELQLSRYIPVSFFILLSDTLEL